jgi:hypothetical protein
LSASRSTALDALAFACFLSFIVTTSNRALPLHDRWAGTEAVRM